jgi:RND family efflux transporter MFP subunit
MRFLGIVLLLAGSGFLSACDEPAKQETVVRPVRTVQVAYVDQPVVADQVGEIEPHYESDLGFRIGGQVAERHAELGQVLKKGQIIARLDDQDQRNQLAEAEADLAAAQATLVQATSDAKRKEKLYADGWATAPDYEAAEKTMASAEASVKAAEAKLQLARDQRTYAKLAVPYDGVVTALGAEAGQVVSAGQMIARVARLDRKDAVFSLSQSLLLSLPKNARVTVSLLDAPDISTSGTVLEVSPSADAITRTYTVKVALPEAPDEMRFGMTVSGRFEAGSRRVAKLPSSALFQQDGSPAVWVVDPQTSKVFLAKVEVARIDAGSTLISSGVPDGARVVTAGIQTLWPGQVVKLEAGIGS